MSSAPAKTTHRRFIRPRLRKTAKWGTLILSILLVATWGASVWLNFGYFWKLGIAAGVAEGVMVLGWEYGSPTSPARGQGMFDVHPPTFGWSFEALNQAWMLTVTIPFWAITLPTIALTIVAWRRDAAARRRLLVNHCPACGYDRAGLSTPAAVCPECGAAAPKAVLS